MVELEWRDKRTCYSAWYGIDDESFFRLFLSLVENSSLSMTLAGQLLALGSPGVELRGEG